MSDVIINVIIYIEHVYSKLSRNQQTIRNQIYLIWHSPRGKIFLYYPYGVLPWHQSFQQIHFNIYIKYISRTRSKHTCEASVLMLYGNTGITLLCTLCSPSVKIYSETNFTMALSSF